MLSWAHQCGRQIDLFHSHQRLLSTLNHGAKVGSEKGQILSGSTKGSKLHKEKPKQILPLS